MRRRSWSLGTAESCTGGEIAKRITDLAGVSDIFKGALVTYANEAKSELLGVRPENLRVAGAGPLRGRVELVEFLGERTLAHLKLDGETPLIVTVPAGVASPKLGAHVHLAVDLADAHLFDESGRAHHAREASS